MWVLPYSTPSLLLPTYLAHSVFMSFSIQVEPNTLKNLAQICKEGPALPKDSAARHIIFDKTEYVVAKKDPHIPKEKGFKLAFVGSLPSRIPGLVCV